MAFIDDLEEYSKRHTQKPALISADTGTRLSYGELYNMSGKVYSYLKEHGIGREKVVMICATRGVRPFVVLLGVWRAGAAAVIVETDFAKERMNYIYEDSGSVLFIDDNVFMEMMDYPSQIGHEPTDPHDLALLVYTSGTTGKPKGVLQEYGILEMGIKGNVYEDHHVMEESDRLALTTPLNFTATILMTVPTLHEGGTIVVFSRDVAKNPQLFKKYIEEYHISILFMTSMMINLMKNMLASVKKIITGGELVKNVYIDGIDIYCIYSQSEACFHLCALKIDKEYEVTPIGKPCVESTCMTILDDSGEKVPDGVGGNICYKNPFFRGYLGLPKETEARRIGEYINAGDLGKIIDTGDIVIIGRSDDMIKIRGNRVEPSEIESAIVSTLHVDWAGVRAFSENSTVFICAYYTGKNTIDTEYAKEALRPILASYMIPSFFIHIDAVPLNENGKFNRKALPMPDLSLYRAEYVAPEGEDETLFCAAAEKILGIEKIGAMDDLIELGADSMSIIGILAQLNWPKLSAAMFINGQTPRKIVQLYHNAVSKETGDIESENESALCKDQPLTATQLYMFDYQCFIPKSTAWNLYLLLKLDPAVDLVRLQSAIETVLRNHPVFSTVLCFNDNNDLVQRFVPDVDMSVEIESMSEADFVDECDDLIKPYKLMNSKLYRIRLIKTERGGYLYIDIHHIIADGNSLQVLIRDLCDAYEGKTLQTDYYYYEMNERHQESLSDLYGEAKEYYSHLLDNVKWDSWPLPDHSLGKGEYGNFTALIPVEFSSYDELQKKYSVSKNAFYIAVSLLSIAFYNKSEDVRISWTFSGRDKETDANIIGALIRDFYIGIRLSKTPTIAELYKEVLRQIRNNIYYSCYSYEDLDEANSVDAELIYQSNLRNIKSDSSLKFTMVEIEQGNIAADNLMDIEIHEKDEGCMLYVDYMADCYDWSSINRFRKVFLKTACQLIKHISEPDTLIEFLRKEIV